MPRGGGEAAVGVAGPSLWCHVGAGVDQAALIQLLDRLPDVPLVLTGARGGALTEAAERRAAHLTRAPDMRNSLDRFLTDQRVGAALFTGSDYPRIGAEACRARDLPVFLAAATRPRREGLRGTIAELSFRPRRSLRYFDRILAARAEDVAEIVRMGADADRVEYVGPMTEIAEPLPCNESDRRALSDQISTRPVWCAVRPTLAEIARIEAAHRRARRLSHRLLLIVAPDDPAAGPGLAETLERHGWTVGLRSLGADPEPDSQIYIADTEGEEGLWFRLSPITFVGGSLSDAGARIDPFAAAVLGSAVICGPQHGRFAAPAERLQKAGACLSVATGDDLGDAVTDLLAPERTAAMAARGWDITSAGADLIGRLADLIEAALDGTRR